MSSIPTPTPAAFRALVEEAERLCRPLSREDFNWQPSDRKWSVGQCIEHLNVAGSLLLPHLEAGIERGLEKGRVRTGGFEPGPVERYLINAMAPANRRRMRTPPSFVPASDLEVQAVLAGFAAVQERFAACAEKLGGGELRVRIRSGATPLIRLRPMAWLAMTHFHEQRHLEQARRTLSLLSAEAAP
jgi:hypothetical protein